MVPTYIREEERKEGKGKEEKREERKIERKMKDGILHTSPVALLPLKAAPLVLHQPLSKQNNVGFPVMNFRKLEMLMSVGHQAELYNLHCMNIYVCAFPHWLHHMDSDVEN